MIVESCLADFEEGPVFSLEILVDVNNVEILVLAASSVDISHEIEEWIDGLYHP